MALETVSGKLSDFGWGGLTAFAPILEFIPTNAAVDPYGRVLATRHIAATVLSNGDFTVQLAGTDNLRPVSTGYQVSIRWLDFFGFDLFDFTLFVPDGGGEIGGIISAPSNPGLVFVSLTEPPRPSLSALWLNADPLDPTSGTGDLKKWS